MKNELEFPNEKALALLLTAFARRKSSKTDSPEILDQMIIDLKPGQGILIEQRSGVTKMKIIKYK